jgi:hypothetical protein
MFMRPISNMPLRGIKCWALPTAVLYAYTPAGLIRQPADGIRFHP